MYQDRHARAHTTLTSTNSVSCCRLCVQGVIDHAIRFTGPNSRPAFAPPASHFAAAGDQSDPQTLPWMGMRVRAIVCSARAQMVAGAGDVWLCCQQAVCPKRCFDGGPALPPAPCPCTFRTLARAAPLPTRARKATA
jgi:hypothetical protein